MGCGTGEAPIGLLVLWAQASGVPANMLPLAPSSYSCKPAEAPRLICQNSYDANSWLVIFDISCDVGRGTLGVSARACALALQQCTLSPAPLPGFACRLPDPDA